MNDSQELKKERYLEGYEAPLQECPCCGSDQEYLSQHVLNHSLKRCLKCWFSWRELDNKEIIILFDPRHEEIKRTIGW